MARYRDFRMRNWSLQSCDDSSSRNAKQHAKSSWRNYIFSCRHSFWICSQHARKICSFNNHIEAVNEGDYLVAESVIEKVNNKLGFNIIEVKRGDELVALFKGVVYRTQKDWEE